MPKTMKIIGKQNPRLRVAVGDASNLRSNIWRIGVRKSDVYVSTGIKSAKFSFHESGICRDAFTGEFGVPPGMEDRVMKRWKRAEIPPPNSGQACSVLELAFPTDFLSAGLDVPSKDICWVDPAAAGNSRCVEMFFSADAPEQMEPLFLQGERTPIAAVRLANGLWFYVGSHEISFGGQELRIPATGVRKFDFVVTRQQPLLPRSARILVMTDPGDGDKMVAWEYGAMRCEPGEYQVEGTLTPDRVFHSTSWDSKA
jgi:hypothetical protein